MLQSVKLNIQQQINKACNINTKYISVNERTYKISNIMFRCSFVLVIKISH